MKLNEKKDKFNIVTSFTNAPLYDFNAFAKGYHNSAKILSEKFLSQNGFRDYEGYPIVFLYRHAFELNLKNIIYWGVRLSNLKNIGKFHRKLYNHHKLTDLAQISGKILTSLFPMDKDLMELIPKVEQIAIEFTELDKNSYSYRYPINVKGNYSAKKHQVVSISSISTCMEDLLCSLEAINFGLEIETDKIEEIIEILLNFSER